MPRGCHVVRVFTREGAGGNYLGVVNDVSGLTDAAMQEVATDLGFSETVFADWRDDARPAQLRIFTPAAEIPFAGHPLVGTAWVYAMVGPGGPGVMECPAGVVTYRMDGAVMWVDAPISVDVAEAAETTDRIVAAGYPVPVRTWRVRLPQEYLVAEVADDDAVAAAEASPTSDEEIYLFHRRGDRVHARFFAPTYGVPEDPATGSAAVALAHALAASGQVNGSVTIHQGAEMGHPSEILLEWSPATVRIGGTVSHEEVRFLDA